MLLHSFEDTLAAFLVLLIGLSMASLCVNVAQRRMELRYMAAMKVMEVAYQHSLAHHNTKRRPTLRLPHHSHPNHSPHSSPRPMSRPRAYSVTPVMF